MHRYKIFCVFLHFKTRNHLKRMEQLLHYVWKHRMFPLEPLATTDGQRVEVIDPGLHNYNAGPDFFNAKVRIGGTLWVGNVEIHDRASDWFLHGHDRDPHYDNVVLHVVGVADAQATTSLGQHMPQMVLSVPQTVADNYHRLLTTEKYPPCYRIIPDLTRLEVHSWMSALQTERLEQKTEAIIERLKQANGSWQDAYFATLARNFGFGINGDAFEEWAAHIPLQSVAHHSDNPLQVEAIFLGQARLLSDDALPKSHREEAMADDYLRQLRSEYSYLRHKFQLEPMDGRLWKYLRLRPQNFPHIRIAQLANLYCLHRAGIDRVLECKTAAEARRLLSVGVTPYWQSHYTFGVESKKSDKKLSAASLNVVLINTVVPTLFAYGRATGDERLCDRSFDMLEELKAEDNNVTRMWQEVGLPVESAGDSQALLQLKKQYCDRRDCLRCRFGYDYLKMK